MFPLVGASLKIDIVHISCYFYELVTVKEGKDRTYKYIRLVELNDLEDMVFLCYLSACVHTINKVNFFCASFMFLFCLIFAMSLCASVYMCFVVTCWERADLLALVCGV